MSLLKRLLGRGEPPKPRVRVCIECGMPVAEHKEWCSILSYQRDMEARSAAKGQPAAQSDGNQRS